MAWRHEYDDLAYDIALQTAGQFRKRIYLDPTNGSDGWKGAKFTQAKKSLSAALTQILTARGDVIYYIAGTSGITLASTILWTYNYTQLRGVNSGNAQGARSRFFHQAASVGAVSPMLTVSGTGNYFSDIYFSHGNGHADNHNVCTVSGSYNRFDRVNFAGPLNATEGADTAYKTLIVSGAYNHFNHCIIGLDTAGMSAALCLLNLAGTNHSMNTFEDCVFLMQANAATPLFIVDSPTSGQGTGSLFKRCSFINVRGQAQTITYAMTWAEAGGGLAHIFDQCTFFGVADIIATGNVSRVQFVQYGETNAKIGLSANPAV